MCFVLHATPYQETSLIVDALTADFGRISFVAKGARGVKNSLKSKLQLFVPLKITIFGKPGSLRTLRTCEIAGEPFNYLPPILFSALYVNELTALLYRVEDASHIIFAAYMNALSQLNAGDFPETVLREFEFDLLAELGYAINLKTEADTNRLIKPHTWYSYDPKIGFLEISLHAAEQKILANQVFNGSDILAIQSGNNYSEKTVKVAKTLCRMSIEALLNNRKLKSRELYLDYLAIGKTDRTKE